jgi:AcrR family transcriptional regulator
VTGPRPVGRPRSRASEAAQQDGASDIEAARSPRDAIVAAATRLFAAHGYQETTMSDIAKAAGLQQSSLYYWFRRKELILQDALVVNRAPLEFIGRVGAGSGSPALKLYRLLRFDTRQLAEAAVDFNEIERVAESQPEEFADFWRDYTRLHEWVTSLVRAGIAEGMFIECDPSDTATALLCFDEGMQKRYRFQQRHAVAGASPFVHRSRSAQAWAETVASLSVRALLAQPESLTDIVAAAALFADDGCAGRT